MVTVPLCRRRLQLNQLHLVLQIRPCENTGKRTTNDDCEWLILALRGPNSRTTPLRRLKSREDPVPLCVRRLQLHRAIIMVFIDQKRSPPRRITTDLKMLVAATLHFSSFEVGGREKLWRLPRSHCNRVDICLHTMRMLLYFNIYVYAYIRNVNVTQGEGGRGTHGRMVYVNACSFIPVILVRSALVRRGRQGACAP